MWIPHVSYGGPFMWIPHVSYGGPFMWISRPSSSPPPSLRLPITCTRDHAGSKELVSLWNSPDFCSQKKSGDAFPEKSSFCLKIPLWGLLWPAQSETRQVKPRAPKSRKNRFFQNISKCPKTFRNGVKTPKTLCLSVVSLSGTLKRSIWAESRPRPPSPHVES